MRLLLISLDGLWEKDLSILDKLPYIGALIRRGTICTKVQTVYPALTYPVHATLLTGCRPAMHGIEHNQPFSPHLKAVNRPWYWDASHIKKPTIHQIVHKNGGKTASILWPVTGKNNHIRWNFPEVLALPNENQTMKMLRYGTAWWIIKTEMMLGKQRKGIHQPYLDDYAALLAESLLLGSHPPDLMTLHLVDCDEMRHRFGADSYEAGEAMERLDRRVGLLLTALDKRRLGQDTVVALVSDHGLADVHHHINLDYVLSQAGFGEICKIQSTGMGAYVHFMKENAQQRGAVQKFLEDNKDKLGIESVYGASNLDSMGAGRHIRLAVEAKSGIAFLDEMAGDKQEKATHGFGPNHPASKCLFLLSGPGIKKDHALSYANMTDIAPTLMHAIGINMQETEGTILSDCFVNEGKW